MGYSAKEFFSAEREKTNADQVRHMSNEELKAWYCELRSCSSCRYGRGVTCSMMKWLRSKAGAKEAQ